MVLKKFVSYVAARTFGLTLFGSIGAILGVVIFFWGLPSTPESRSFVKSPEFVTWFFINDVLFAAYPILLCLIWKPLNYLRKYFHSKLEIFIAIVIFFALYIVPILLGSNIVFEKPLPLQYYDAKVLILMSVGFFAGALPPLVGSLLIQIGVRDTFEEIEPTENAVQTYFRLRDYLQQFLLTLGALQGLYILTSAALRRAALSTGATNPIIYPPIILLLIGAYYSLLVAFVYFPPYLALVSAGKRLVDAFFALPAPDHKSWSNIYSKRKQLEELLELNIAPAQRFVNGLTVLAPFVSSIFFFLAEK